MLEKTAFYTEKEWEIRWAPVCAAVNAVESSPGNRTKEQVRNHYYAINRESIYHVWTPEEDEKLIPAVEKYGNDWAKISDAVFNGEIGRKAICGRHQTLKRRTSETIKKIHITFEQDEQIAELLRQEKDIHVIAEELGISCTKLCNHIKSKTFVRQYPDLTTQPIPGTFTEEEDKIILDAVQEVKKSWPEIAKLLPGKTAKQCRERYRNFLSPDPFKPWGEDEDRQLVNFVNRHGQKWNIIAIFFQDRTPTSIKNHWFADLKSRIEFDCDDGKLKLKAERNKHITINAQDLPHNSPLQSPFGIDVDFSPLPPEIDSKPADSNSFPMPPLDNSQSDSFFFDDLDKYSF